MFKSSKNMLKIMEKVNAVVVAFFFVFYPLYPVLTMPVAYASDANQPIVAETNAIAPTESPTSTDVPVPTEAPTIESSISPEPSISPSAEPVISPEPSVEPLLPASPEPNPVVSPEPSPSINPEPTNTSDGVWHVMPNGKAQTRSVVSMNKTYIAPQNENVTVKFTELPDNPGVLTINEIKLSAEEQAQLGAISDIAYDITSTMPDGSFKYDLTLPKPSDAKDIRVKFAETKTDLMNEAQTVTQNTEEASDAVRVGSLDHFTLFIVTGQPSGNTNIGWNNQTKAYVSDDVRASAGSSGDILELKSFNLNTIPSGVIIKGIEVSVEGYTGGTRQANVSLSWDNGTSYTAGAGTGLKTTNVPGTTTISEAVTTLGGATDLWGRTWSTGDFADAKFRVKLNSTTGTGSESVYVDQVKVSVTYEDDVPSCPAPTIAKGTRLNDEYVSGNTIYYATDKGTGTGNFVVSEAATDANSGIDKVNFPATGGITGGGNANSAPYQKTYSWTNTDTYNSSATITCYDNSGQTSTSTLNVLRDNTAPVVNSVGLDKYVVKNGDTIDITSNVVETGSGIASCHAYWANHTGIATGTDTDLGDLGTDCSGSVTVPASSGNHYILIGSTSGLGDNVGHFQTVGLASSIITVDNISPVITISNPTTTPEQSKTITASTNEGTLTMSNTTGSVCDASLIFSPYSSQTFTSESDNGKKVCYKAIDTATNTTYSLSNAIAGIDITSPTATISYNVTAPTNGDVIATLNPSEPVTVTNNSGSTTYTFTENGTFVFEFTDVAGNTGTATATVGNIDKTSPNATIFYNITEPTNGSVVATLHPNESVTVTNNGGLTTYNFTDNGSFTFNFVDAAGNTGNATATVNNIDKTAPIITINPYNTDPTNQNIIVTASTNEGILNTTSHEFTANDSFDFVATDAAGNSTTTTVTISNIDVTPPQFTSAATKDLDGNGKIDTIELAFNETIDHSRLAVSGNDGWSVDGYTVSKVDTKNGENDNILLLGLVEGPGHDSGNTPTVSYTSPAESTHDIAGNELVSNSWTPTDEAKPVVLSAETQDVNGNGQIDNIKLTFSEAINDSELTTGADGWDVVGFDGDSIGTGSVANDNILLLGFNESGSYDVDSTPTVTYSSPAESTHDIAGNELANYSATTTDKSAPTKPIANPVGGDYYADQSVTLAGETGAEIRYTTDGTDPSASSTQYIGTPILINHSQTLKAIVIDPASNVSPIMTEGYGIAPIVSGESIIHATTGTPGTEQIITWDTDDISTSRVVYGLNSVSVSGHPEYGSNYGYQHTTPTYDLAPNKVTNHVVTLTGLKPDKVYYYRVISAGSPESYSAEMDFKTGTDHETADSSGSGTSTSTPTTTKLATVLGTTTVAQNATPNTQSLTSTTVGINNVTNNSSGSSSSQPEKATPEKGTVEAAAVTASPNPTQSKNSRNGIQINWWLYLIALIVILVMVYYLRRQTKNKQG